MVQLELVTLMKDGPCYFGAFFNVHLLDGFVIYLVALNSNSFSTNISPV